MLITAIISLPIMVLFSVSHLKERPNIILLFTNTNTNNKLLLLLFIWLIHVQPIYFTFSPFMLVLLCQYFIFFFSK